MPREGGAILVCNHSDYVDPLVQALFSGRRLTFLGKAELLELGWLRKIQGLLSQLDRNSLEGSLAELADEFLNVSGQVVFDIYQQTLADRSGESAQSWPGLGPQAEVDYTQDLPKLCQLLAEGQVLSLYPERKAGPEPKLAPFQDLPLELSARSGCPIVPAGLYGTHGLSSLRHWLLGRNLGRAVVYRMGPPLWPDPANPDWKSQVLEQKVSQLSRRFSPAAGATARPGNQ